MKIKTFNVTKQIQFIFSSKGEANKINQHLFKYCLSTVNFIIETIKLKNSKG